MGIGLGFLPRRLTRRLHPLPYLALLPPLFLLVATRGFVEIPSNTTVCVLGLGKESKRQSILSLLIPFGLLKVVDTFSQDGFFFFFIIWDVGWTTYSDLYHSKSCNFRSAIKSRLRALARDHLSISKLLQKLHGKGPRAFLL